MNGTCVNDICTSDYNDFKCSLDSSFLSFERGLKFSAFEATSVHPGIIATKSDFYEIDAPVKSIHGYDAKNYREALLWAEKEVLNNNCSFDDYSIMEMYKILLSLNSKILGESVGIRKSPILTAPNKFDLTQPLSAHSYFASRAKNDLENYNTFYRFTKNLGFSLHFGLFEVMEKEVEPHYSFLKRYVSYNRLAPSEIKSQLKKAFNDFKVTYARDPLKAAAYLHMDLVRIHPFPDGNGRTARIYTNLILKKSRLPSFSVHRGDNYSRAVQAAFEESNNEFFYNYLKEQVCKSSKRHKDDAYQDGNYIMHILESCGEFCEEELGAALHRFSI